jgi:hypothetical protein
MKNEMSIHRTQRTLAKRAFGTNAEAVAMETAIKEAVNFIFFKEFFVEQHNKICEHNSRERLNLAPIAQE